MLLRLLSTYHTFSPQFMTVILFIALLFELLVVEGDVSADDLPVGDVTPGQRRAAAERGQRRDPVDRTGISDTEHDILIEAQGSGTH